MDEMEDNRLIDKENLPRSLEKIKVVELEKRMETRWNLGERLTNHFLCIPLSLSLSPLSVKPKKYFT